MKKWAEAFFSKFWLDISLTDFCHQIGFFYFKCFEPVFRICFDSEEKMFFCFFSNGNELESGFWGMDKQSKVLVPCVGSSSAKGAWCVLAGVPYPKGFDREEDKNSLYAISKMEGEWELFYYNAEKSPKSILMDFVLVLFGRQLSVTRSLFKSSSFRVVMVLFFCLGIVFGASDLGVFR